MLSQTQQDYVNKAHTSFGFSKDYFISYDFKNSYGVFFGVYSLIGDKKKALRFNFIGNELNSFDFWSTISNEPTQHIELNGADDNEVFTLLTNLVYGRKIEARKIINRLTEAGANPIAIETFNLFIQENNLNAFELKRTPALQLYKKFTDWFDSLPEERTLALNKFSKSSFDRILTQSLAQRGETTNFAKNKTTVKVMRGDMDIYVDTAEIVGLETEFQEVMENSYEGLNRLASTFDFLESEIKALIKGRRTGLIVCGQSGVGKTYKTKEFMKEYGGWERGRYMRGTVKTERDLVLKLYEHKDDKIIVFDDVDTLFRNPKCIDMLNAILESENKRKLQILDMKLVKDFDLPTSFNFTSRVIIITNKRPNTIPQKLVDRCPIIEFKASKLELIQWIKDNSEGLLHMNDEKVTEEAKEAVITYFIEIMTQVKFFSFRNFKFACLRFEECQEDSKGDVWKDWTLADLQSGAGGRF